MCAFVFDVKKSERNALKHGIDFVQAQAIWLDAHRLEISAREIQEQRLMVIGQIDGRHWSAIFTLREGLIRLISVRRSRATEIEQYEESKQDATKDPNNC